MLLLSLGPLVISSNHLLQTRKQDSVLIASIAVRPWPVSNKQSTTPRRASSLSVSVVTGCCWWPQGLMLFNDFYIWKILSRENFGIGRSQKIWWHLSGSHVEYVNITVVSLLHNVSQDNRHEQPWRDHKKTKAPKGWKLNISPNGHRNIIDLKHPF